VTDLAFPTDLALTTTSLSLPDQTSRRVWEDVGVRLMIMDRAAPWWIGDWYLFGERRYGEQASQAAEVGYRAGTLSNAVAVCSRIEMPRRRGNLTFGHHQNVAYLPPVEQDYWLDEAEGGEWTVREMRARIKRGRTNGEESSIEYSTTAWADLAGLMESIESLLYRDAADLAAAVPDRRRATTAKRLRKLGTGLGRIAWTLEGMEESDGSNAAA
jgi:hypothetical protein